MKFLIDECLSLDLISIAGQAGHAAEHVARLGKAGWKDWNVVRYAAAGDFILVTNNASDFRRLYARELLHAGLVIIIPSVTVSVQRQLFRGTLETLAAQGEPINQVLEVDLHGDEVSFTIYDWPSAD